MFSDGVLATISRCFRAMGYFRAVQVGAVPSRLPGGTDFRSAAHANVWP